MKGRYLYMLGGNSFQSETNQDFINRSGGSDAKIALCIMNSPGWENYVPRFENMWKQIGNVDVEVIVPDQNGKLDMKKVENSLLNSTGIFIGGGDTLLYQHYYASKEIKRIMKSCYSEGIPIAGNSAGALILPEHCIISPTDNAEGKIIYKEGIGLISNMLVSVHFTEWNDKENTIEAMKTTKIQNGIGIDEEACAVFVNEELQYTYGDSVYRIYFEDFENGTYEVNRIVTRKNNKGN